MEVPDLDSEYMEYLQHYQEYNDMINKIINNSQVNEKNKTKLNTRIIVNNYTYYDSYNELEINGKFLDEIGNNIQTKENSPLIIEDVKYPKVSLSEVYTNDDGSFQTRFKLTPNQILNNYTISDTNSLRSNIPFDIIIKSTEDEDYSNSSTIISIENINYEKVAFIAEKSNITINIPKQNNKSINSGYCIFKINGLTLKDTYNNTLKRKVKNGTVVLDYLIPSNYKAKEYTLETVYVNSSNEFKSVRLYSKIQLIKRNLNLKIGYNKIDQNRNYEFKPVLYMDNRRVNSGFVIFKINGITLKDANNKTIRYYLNSKMNETSLKYQIPLHWSAKNIKLTVVYNDSTYGRIENSTFFKLDKTSINMNIGISKSYNNKISVYGAIKNQDNENINGSNVIGVKINDNTLKDENGNSLYFKIDNGNVNFTFSLPDKYKNGIIKITFTIGERNAYYGERKVKYNII